MVGFCHLTDSHHYHHGQKPTMVGICHGGNMPEGHDDDHVHLAHARRNQGDERGSSVSTQNVRSRSFFAWGHNCWNSDGDGGRCFIVDICDQLMLFGLYQSHPAPFSKPGYVE